MSVIIRAATSLTTDNQPLFVVYGVPMSEQPDDIAERQRQPGRRRQRHFGYQSR